MNAVGITLVNVYCYPDPPQISDREKVGRWTGDLTWHRIPLNHNAGYRRCESIGGAASADGAVKQFDATSMKEVRAYPAGSDWLFSVDYDPEAHRVAAGSFTGDITIWDSQTGQSVTAFKSQPGGTPKSVSRLVR